MPFNILGSAQNAYDNEGGCASMGVWQAVFNPAFTAFITHYPASPLRVDRAGLNKREVEAPFNTSKGTCSMEETFRT